MLHISRWQISFILTICIFALWYGLPNVLKEHTPSFMPDKQVNLGLDLRGGSYLLLEVGFDSYHKEQLENLRQEIRQIFRGEKINGQRIRYQGGVVLNSTTIRINLTDASQSDEVVRLIRKNNRNVDVDQKNGTLSVYFHEQALREMKENLITQSIEIVRRRVDETGTTEPDIQRQGTDRILLQVPGLQNPEQLKSLLGKTAKMSFHLVDTSVPVTNMARGPVPPGSVRLKSDADNQYYIIKKPVIIGGDLLVDARYGQRDGRNVVNIRFNTLGAKKFADVTKTNMNKPFAIVLDNKVLTAPYIRAVILDGNAEISGRFTPEAATELAMLLRSGALPAPLEIIEERTVGPSLGADSISAGTKAIILGFGLVIIFMIFAYGLYGIFSDIALIFNVLLLTAVLSSLGATLTLPGIAGIVLTVGMAVDANVLIFERIREELRNGRPTLAAVDYGFKQAFKTILDANITTFIAAALLFVFGSGPVKGFAVTLSIGILSSMFSAVLLTRWMVASWVTKRKPKTLNI